MASSEQASTHSSVPQKQASDWPEVKPIDVSDLTDVLGKAVNDMRQASFMSLFFGIVYALGGVGLMLLFFRGDVPFLIYPTAMGFALLAPFFAAGLYDISRRIETGQPLSWSGVLSSVWHASGKDLGWMAFVTSFAFIIWMDIAAMLTFAFMGFSSSSVTEFVREVFTTPNGVLFLVGGNIAGALIAMAVQGCRLIDRLGEPGLLDRVRIIAMAVFSITVVSFPMLYDRDIDFVTALVRSVRLVLKNKKAMLAWAMTIGWMIAVSILSAFVGLVFILPLLGHATWHLYRRAVAPNAAPRAA